MYARRVIDAVRLEREHPWRGGDEKKEDDGGRGRGGRGMISLGLGGALSLLVELRERMDGIASLFTAKASDVDTLGRTWRQRL